MGEELGVDGKMCKQHDSDVFFLNLEELEKLRDHMFPVKGQRQQAFFTTASSARVCAQERRESVCDQQQLRIHKLLSLFALHKLLRDLKFKAIISKRQLVKPFFGLRRCGRKLLTAIGSAKTRELRSFGTRRAAINSLGRLWTRSRRNL